MAMKATPHVGKPWETRNLFIEVAEVAIRSWKVQRVWSSDLVSLSEMEVAMRAMVG